MELSSFSSSCLAVVGEEERQPSSSAVPQKCSSSVPVGFLPGRGLASADAPNKVSWQRARPAAERRVPHQASLACSLALFSPPCFLPWRITPPWLLRYLSQTLIMECRALPLVFLHFREEALAPFSGANLFTFMFRRSMRCHWKGGGTC